MHKLFGARVIMRHLTVACYDITVCMALDKLGAHYSTRGYLIRLFFSLPPLAKAARENTLSSLVYICLFLYDSLNSYD